MYYMTFIWRKVNITIFMIDEEYISETDVFIWCRDRAIVRIWKLLSELIRFQRVVEILLSYSDFIELRRAHWVIQIPESKTGSGPSLSATPSVSSRWRWFVLSLLAGIIMSHEQNKDWLKDKHGLSRWGISIFKTINYDEGICNKCYYCGNYEFIRSRELESIIISGWTSSWGNKKYLDNPNVKIVVWNT